MNGDGSGMSSQCYAGPSGAAAVAVGPDIRFEVLCVTESVRPSRVTLRSVVGPGDDGQPVVLVMVPHES